MNNQSTAESIARAVERLRETERMRQDFFKSAVFERLLSPFIDRPGPVELDSENFKYNSIAIKRSLGWELELDSDISLFINLMGDNKGPFVDVGSVEEIAGCDFPLFYFENSGLWVSVMIGQGSAITLYNEEAFLTWREKIKQLNNK